MKVGFNSLYGYYGKDGEPVKDKFHDVKIYKFKGKEYISLDVFESLLKEENHAIV